ncbi:MAG: PorT family protein [Bacteroidales bacterium]|nr:PorT family protein [Bacteroidales bacterium]
MKRFLFLLLFLLPGPLRAQEAAPADTLPALTNVYLDTVVVRKVRVLNDYSMLGVNAGVTLSQMQFNPSVKQEWLFTPSYISLVYTRYGKMFGYLPYFGFSAGVAYGHEGYRFKEDKETGKVYTLDGAREAVMDVVEVPFLAQIHFDASHAKVMASAGIYGGYRYSIERSGPDVTDALRYSFKSTDIRWDYGLQGGVGFALVFAPVELHLAAQLRYSWSSIYTPDSSDSAYNQYYYRFAYPLDLMVTAGVHVHLTKRYGKTHAALREEARDIVRSRNEKTADNPGSGR